MSDEEELDVHVKLGLEDLCKLRTGKMALGGGGGGGEPDEPVAEQTKLGWTLLGPVKLVQNNTSSKTLQHYYRRFVTLIARRCKVKFFRNWFAFIFADIFNNDVD